LKEQINSNIIELNEEQGAEWFRGRDVDMTDEQTEAYKHYEGFVAVRLGGDFVGTGNISKDKKILFGFLPKERRRKD
jgi:NOL1/NOP2/fmu family ribosome biogenesis protein